MENGRLRNLIIDDPRRCLFQVHRSAYTSKEILEIERERVFDRSWIYVGHESEVRNPGDFQSRDVAGRPVILIRDSDGGLRVLINSCTQRGAQVCREAEGNARTFQCFYHAWTFNNRGELVGVPDAAGYGGAFRREDNGLRTVPRAESYRGLIFVSFDPEIEDLVTYLAGAKEVLDAILDQ